MIIGMKRVLAVSEPGVQVITGHEGIANAEEKLRVIAAQKMSEAACSDQPVTITRRLSTSPHTAISRRSLITSTGDTFELFLLHTLQAETCPPARPGGTR